MRLALGEQTLDVTTRALVIGILDASTAADVAREAQRLAGDGADLVEVVGSGEPGAMADAVRAVSAAGVPVAVSTACPEVAAAAYAGGAVLGPGGEGVLAVSARAGATVIVTDGAIHDSVAATRAALVERARRAEAAGIPPHRIVVEPSLDRHSLKHVQRFAELGYPLLVTFRAEALDRLTATDEHEDRRALALAATSLAVIGGCRLVRTDDVKGARRVADVLAAVLQTGATVT